MKKLILAVAMASMPLSSFAQKAPDKGKTAKFPEADVVPADEAIEIPAAKKLEDSLAAAIAEVQAAATAFIQAATEAGKSDAERAAAAEKAQAKLEISGMKLEQMYDRAVRLRVKAEAGAKSEIEAAKAAYAAAFAIPAGMREAAAARVRLANAQLEGGAAAADIVERKIAAARAGRDTAMTSEVVARLRAAASAVSRARSAIARGADGGAEDGAKGATKAATREAAKGKGGG